MKTYFNRLFLTSAFIFGFVFLMATPATTSAANTKIKPPTLTITVPKSGQWSNAVYTATGTFKAGKYAVSNVLVSVNNGDEVSAELSNTTWRAQINLALGTNTIAAYAVDTNADHSVTNTAKITYVLVSKVSVEIVGDGKVTPDYDNDFLIIGNHYSMKTKAAAGFVFYYWKERLRAAFPGLIAVPCLIAVRHQPDTTVWLHQGHNQFSLFFGTVRPHEAHNVRQCVLVQPPNASEPLDNNQIVNRRFDPKTVV